MNEKPEIVINIYGGTNQIAPVASTAIQNNHGDRGAEVATQPKDAEVVENTEKLTEDEARLAIYVTDMNHLKKYVELIGQCTSAHELAIVVKEMMAEEESIHKETVVKGAFIEVLQPFATQLVSGNTVDNIRQQINNMLAEKKK